MADTKEPSFEQALEKLEGIIEKLESPDTELEKVIDTNTEGQKLLKSCQKHLDSAQLKLEKALENGQTEPAE
jgi:exodeoxyribonuclease VII small subunit